MLHLITNYFIEKTENLDRSGSYLLFALITVHLNNWYTVQFTLPYSINHDAAYVPSSQISFIKVLLVFELCIFQMLYFLPWRKLIILGSYLLK